MLPGHPPGLFAFLLYQLGVIKFPDNLSVPVNLDEFGDLLMWSPSVGAAQDITTGQDTKRAGDAGHFRPAFQEVTVHVDDRGAALSRGVKDGIAAPGFVRMEHRGAGREDGNGWIGVQERGRQKNDDGHQK